MSELCVNGMRFDEWGQQWDSYKPGAALWPWAFAMKAGIAAVSFAFTFSFSDNKQGHIANVLVRKCYCTFYVLVAAPVIVPRIGTCTPYDTPQGAVASKRAVSQKSLQRMGRWSIYFPKLTVPPASCQYAVLPPSDIYCKKKFGLGFSSSAFRSFLCRVPIYLYMPARLAMSQPTLLKKNSALFKKTRVCCTPACSLKRHTWATEEHSRY